MRAAPPWASVSEPARLVTALSARRASLATRANPASHTDYLVRLEGAVGAGGVMLALAYVPDRTVLAPESFTAYLAALAEESWTGIEEIGAAALADIESELVPRYLRIALTGPERANVAHGAVFEGRQPGWRNDAILARLA